jgi:hypothetical protein
VGGVSSGSQPINKMILKIAMNGLIRRICLICLLNLYGLTKECISFQLK